MTIKHFVFFDTDSTDTTSNTLSSLEGAEEMVMQVTGSGTVNLTVQAKADFVSGGWSDVAAISQKDYTVCDTITSAGIYNISLNGITALRVVNNGSTGVTVYGRVMG